MPLVVSDAQRCRQRREAMLLVNWQPSCLVSSTESSYAGDIVAFLVLAFVAASADAH
jgi:hypothetical protein